MGIKHAKRTREAVKVQKNIKIQGAFYVTMKKIIAICILLSISALLAACGGSTASGPNPVHMNSVDFQQSSITIKKGQTITLINDSGAVHYIENGTWDNGTQRPAIERGAPTVDAQVAGDGSNTIGPFNTAGTFKLYCTVHPDMTLTVIVK
jgi:plastocyanin